MEIHIGIKNAKHMMTRDALMNQIIMVSAFIQVKLRKYYSHIKDQKLIQIVILYKQFITQKKKE